MTAGALMASAVGTTRPRWRRGSPWLCVVALLAIDLLSRASYLAPRLVTLRGLLNYLAASGALFLVVRLLATLSARPRAALFAVLVALPMAVQWAMFRSYGQFVDPVDFLALYESPRVALHAAGAGMEHVGTLVVFGLALASAWLLPPRALPLRRWVAGAAVTSLVGAMVVGATWWRASPSLEHPQPAFTCALVGLMRRATVPSAGAARVTLPRSNGSSAPGTTVPPPNIVLVIGESLAASHLALYGYERDTTPRLSALQKNAQLFAMRDAVVAGPNTRTSVPYILTGLAGPDPDGRIYGAPTVLEYAKARGYHTAFISAQEESWGDLDAMLKRGADTFRTGIQFAAEVDVLKGGDDLVVLERGVLPTLQTLPEPFFLVVHMDGSHMPYGHHSPPSHKVFPEDGVNSMGAYDNTVRVTDEYVARVFEALRARDPYAWMFFTSDHGQALGEGGAFFNRGYQTNVVRDPLLVFPPASVHPALGDWSVFADAQVSACDLAPTIVHLFGSVPSLEAPMDCVDWLAGPTRPHVRVVSAYTPTYLAEQTMLVVLPDGQRALYDVWRGTVTMNDGVRSMTDVPLPPEIERRLAVSRR